MILLVIVFSRSPTFINFNLHGLSNVVHGIKLAVGCLSIIAQLENILAVILKLTLTTAAPQQTALSNVAPPPPLPPAPLGPSPKILDEILKLSTL